MKFIKYLFVALSLQIAVISQTGLYAMEMQEPQKQQIETPATQEPKTKCEKAAEHFERYWLGYSVMGGLALAGALSSPLMYAILQGIFASQK